VNEIEIFFISYLSLLNNFNSKKQITMAIKKQYLKSKPICKVTFSVPAKNAKKVVVAGDFNKWDTKKPQLRKLKNGTFKGTIDLEKDKSYQFKYIIDGTYLNEEQADGYVWNDFAGTENSLLEL